MRARNLFLLLAAVSVMGGLFLAGKRSELRSNPSRDSIAPSGPQWTHSPPSSAQSVSAAVGTPHPAATSVGPPTGSPAADAKALRDEADRLIAKGEALEGLEVFRRAVEADPSAKNHGDLGSLLYRLTAYDEAAIHLRAAAELDPRNADRWIALANLYYRKVDLGEAWKAEKRAREAEPGLELGRDLQGMRVRKGESAPRNP